MKHSLPFFFLLLISSLFAQTNMGKFKDPRDGEVYTTVKIANRVWLAENMRYKVDGSLENPNNPNKFYGRLYNWEQAKQACPKGWHIPIESEWQNLFELLGGTEKAGTSLKANNSWIDADSISSNGNNISGFNALPAGGSDIEAYGEKYNSLGLFAYFWSASDTGTSYNTRYELYNERIGDLSTDFMPSAYYSCRCIQGKALQQTALEEELKQSLKSRKGSLKDPRDNKVYATIKIGKQTWMAENMRFAIDGSFDHKENPAHGNLYNWEQAMRVCPKGWHLPSREDWDSLTIFLGYKVVKFIISGSDWGINNAKATNQSGLSVLPSGMFDSKQMQMLEYGETAYFWTSNTDDLSEELANTIFIPSNSNYFSSFSLGFKQSDYHPCRCLKD